MSDEFAELRETAKRWADDNRAGGIIDREPLEALLADYAALQAKYDRLVDRLIGGEGSQWYIVDEHGFFPDRPAAVKALEGDDGKTA